jgi:hypothetical protein
MDNNKINKNMDTKTQETLVKPQPQKQPDERSGVHIQGHIKIFDPETNDVFVNGRA